MNGRHEPAPYRIRVKGLLGETLLTAFPGMAAHSDHGETVLVGSLLDQAALHGVLAEIEALGLELIELHRLEASARAAESTASDDDGSSGSAGPFDLADRHETTERSPSP